MSSFKLYPDATTEGEPYYVFADLTAEFMMSDLSAIEIPDGTNPGDKKTIVYNTSTFSDTPYWQRVQNGDNSDGVSVGGYAQTITRGLHHFESDSDYVYFTAGPGGSVLDDGTIINYIAKVAISTNIYEDVASNSQVISGVNGGILVSIDHSTEDIIVFGGSFQAFSGTGSSGLGFNPYRIAFFNVATQEFGGYNDGTHTGLNNAVNSLHFVGTDLYVGGNFTNLAEADGSNGSTATRVAIWDGTTWSGITDATGVTGFNAVVSAITSKDDIVYFGGQFTAFVGPAGAACPYIAQYNTITNTFSLLDDGAGKTGFDGSVESLEIIGDKLYVGGKFTEFDDGNPTGSGQIVAWDITNSQWIALGQYPLPAPYAQITGLREYDGLLYVGGGFNGLEDNQPGTVNAGQIAVYDPETDTITNLTDADTNYGVHYNGFISDNTKAFVGPILKLPNGTLYVGGYFNFTIKIGGGNEPVGGIAKYGLRELPLRVSGNFWENGGALTEMTLDIIGGMKELLWNGSYWLVK